MPSASKNAAASKDRRKSDKVEPKIEKAEKAESNKGATLLVTLTVPPTRLREALGIKTPPPTKEDTPVKDKESPATSNTVPAEPSSIADNASDSTPGTPAAGTPAPSSSMGPPVEGPKKKGTKRSAAAANGGDPLAKVRGKPGPKKKARLDDAGVEITRGGLGHKLGPKANMGAINAGLRALDRSGKPCRKWAKGGFQLKSFTGTVWTIPRWTAPPRPRPEAVEDPNAVAAAAAAADAGAAAGSNGGTPLIPNTSTPPSAEGSSGKENNKENEQVASKSENSNSGGDVEMHSAAPSIMNGNSPAPALIAAAS